MNRRTFIKSATAGLAGLGLAGCATKSTMPHVILVTMDTTTRQRLSCYGYERETSPNLDAFAGESILFEDFYSNTNITLPGHATLLTGLYPHSSGVIIQQPLNPDIPTLATLLKSRGYQTAAVTSCGLLTAGTIGQGFDYFNAPVRDLQNRADQAFGHAEKWLNRVGGKGAPVFLWVHLIDPHTDYDAPAPFADKFLSGEKDKLRLKKLGLLSEARLNCESNNNYLFTEDDQRLVTAMYDSEIAYMDAEIGKFFGFLKKRGFYDNAIMAMTADHGETLFEIDRYWSGHHFINEPTMQIPMIIRHPDYSATRVKGFTQQIDLLPTLMEWLNIDPMPLDGKSMVSAVGTNTPLRDVVYYAEDGSRYLGITDGKTKIRRLYWRQETAFEAPQQWHDDAAKLPRITFSSNSFSDMKFAERGGKADIEWQCPEECVKDLHMFKIQRLIHPDRSDGEITTAANKRFMRTGGKGGVAYSIPSPRFWNFFHQFGRRMFRVLAVDKNDRLIAVSDVVFMQYDSAMDTTEVYDLVADPNERTNIAGDNPAQAANLMAKLDVWALEVKKALKEAKHEEVSDDLREALESLGYLE
jgi:arylsulfatase A-like enzyme